MTLRFGTDGIRGVANRDLTPELVTAVGRAAARVLGRETYFIGRDTRRSGSMLEAALVAGLCAEGASAERLDVAPTPAVAYACATWSKPGAVVSASHNPFPDNGVKFFAAGGRKLGDDVERRLENELRVAVEGTTHAAEGVAVGEARLSLTVLDDYVDHLVQALEGRTLDSLPVVLDCANGAASETGPHALRRAGSHLTVINAEPNGSNINDGCGSTDPRALLEAVTSTGASAGLALDGDADRVIAVDERGEIVDGDHMLAILAVDRHERGRLVGDAVVATVMSNIGLRHALAGFGIELVETPVGDRSVLVALEERGLSLGGEQSGHLVVTDHATTGDGVLTGLLLLDVMARTGRPLSELARLMTPLPQVLRNVRVVNRDALDDAPELRRAIETAERELGADGRVLVRPSGTEPVVRVMVEATSPEQAGVIADRLERAVEGTCGAA